MAPIHGHEYLVFERLQERRHKQEQRRRLAHPRQPYPHCTQHLMSRLGTFFVALGTKMQRIEQHGERTV